MGARKYDYEDHEDILGCLHDQTRISRISGVGRVSMTSAASSEAPAPVRSGVVPARPGAGSSDSPAIPRSATVPLFVVGVREPAAPNATPRWPSAIQVFLGSAAFLAAVVAAAFFYYA